LYPWHFTPRQNAGNPLGILLHAWHPAPGRFLLRDIVVNISLYIPLGFAAQLVLRKSRAALFGPVLLGLLLSTAVELVQLYEPARDTNLVDVTTNVIGSILGVTMAVLFERIARPEPSRAHRMRMPADRAALLLAFCWAAWLFFPFFPVLGRHELYRKLVVFGHSPVLAPTSLVSTAAAWYVAGLLLSAARIRRAAVLLALSILAIPAQFFVVERQPVTSALLGAIAGFLLFALRPRAPLAMPITKTEAWAFSAIIIFRGLSPFGFVPASSAFAWTPFSGMLGMDWQSAILVLLEKIFYYASAIWLLRSAGLRLLNAAAIVAVILAAIEIAQTHLPGRTAETTDPLVAVLMGFIFLILSRETGKQSRSAG
jgi:VanZ family protein